MRRGSWVVLPGASPVTEAAAHRRVGHIGARPSARWRVERAPITVPEAAAPPAGWYTRRWGTEFVRTLDARCREVFDNCRIAAGTHPGDLFYTFEHDGTAGTIAFPPTFPQDDPTLVVAGNEVPLAPYQPRLSQDDLADILVRAALASASGQGGPAVDEAREVLEPTEEVFHGLDARPAAEA